MMLHAAIAIILGYLMGSFPTGVLVGRYVGVDVRSVGSGKTGATNVLRSAGWRAGLIVAVIDTLKGALPVLLAEHLYATTTQVGSAATWIAALSGLAAIIGHNYPIFAGFRGGRGVATTGGIALALTFPATLIAAIFFFAIVAYTRYVSLGSMLGSVFIAVFALLFLITGHGNLVSGLPGVLLVIVASVTIIYSHRDNIQRLRSGTERKLGEHATPTPHAAH